MFLSQLKLYNFKSHRDKSFEFSENVLLICGPNGSGKTNLLEAIYILSHTKSFLSHFNNQILSYGENKTIIKGWITKEDGRQNILKYSYENKQKNFSCNEKKLRHPLRTYRTVSLRHCISVR